jgi:phosphoribosylaminoimidazole-succinocarboxamide synthase
VSEAPALEHLSSGKVRDIYAVGEDRLLLVASDRISTYDVVHPTPIPDKGKVLTGLTAFWLELKRVPVRLRKREAGAVIWRFGLAR